MDVPAGIRRSGLGRWTAHRAADRASDRIAAFWEASVPDLVRRYRKEVGALRCVGFGGRRRVRAASKADACEVGVDCPGVVTFNGSLGIPDTSLISAGILHAKSKRCSKSTSVVSRLKPSSLSNGRLQRIHQLQFFRFAEAVHDSGD